MFSGQELFERSFRRIDRCDLDILVCNQLDDRLSLFFIILNDQQVFGNVIEEIRNSSECLLQCLLADRFCEIRESASSQTLLPALDAAYDMNGDVTSVGVVLEALHHLPSIHSR